MTSTNPDDNNATGQRDIIRSGGGRDLVDARESPMPVYIIKGTASNDHLIYDKLTGNLFFDSNGNEAGGMLKIAAQSKGLALTHNDFDFPVI